MLNIVKSKLKVPLSCFLSVFEFFNLMMLNNLTSLNRGKLFNGKRLIWCFWVVY